MGIAALAYLLGIVGIQSQICCFTNALYIQMVDIYGIVSYAVQHCAIIPNLIL